MFQLKRPTLLFLLSISLVLIPIVFSFSSSSAPVLFLLFQNVLCANAECCLSDTLILFLAFILMYCFTVLSVLMLDEAHERTLYTDIAIGLLKKVFPSFSPFV